MVMGKSPESKANYAARREVRLRRDKTAALVLQGLLACPQPLQCGAKTVEGMAREYAKVAVLYADALLAELDRTRADLKPAEGGG